ncbi:MAG: hypothetical protein CVV12_15220 [Gammaproteobacteria bacterium HGW-Gammaproteobacteria-2]|nr:MAG: hypothetical protein CVV12_15220 [Gammaproteobacteria bacterium HGW-Gammaproteobacteria-2]
MRGKVDRKLLERERRWRLLLSLVGALQSRKVPQRVQRDSHRRPHLHFLETARSQADQSVMSLLGCDQA